MLVGAAVAQIRCNDRCPFIAPFRAANFPPVRRILDDEAEAILACFREPDAPGSNFILTNAGCSCESGAGFRNVNPGPDV